jgi:NitT/TauT family transport system permease protein
VSTNRIAAVGYPLVTLVVLAVAWQIGAVAADSLLIPTFTETAVAIVQLLFAPSVWEALAVSNQALAIGMVLSLLVGIPAGLAIGRFQRVNRLTSPYLTILLTLPTAGLIPLLIMSIGIGLEARILVVILFAVTVLIVNARAGVREVSPTLIEMARSFGADEGQLWRKILLPAATPAILVGVRLALSRGVTGMVIVELLLVAAGIGNLILTYQSQFQPARLYAMIVIVVIEALVLIAAAKVVSRRLAPWAEDVID